MIRNQKNLFALLFISIAAAVGVWALLRFTAPRWTVSTSSIANPLPTSTDSWEEAVAKVKEDRPPELAAQAGAEVPEQLRQYSDTRWFLAAQIADVQKHNLQTSQDFVDLAGMIERGELVSLPALTDTYILYGVGATADDSRFSRFQDDHAIELYSDAELRDAYARFDSTRADLQSRIANARRQMATIKKGERAKQKELQKDVSAREQELKAVDDQAALLKQFYGDPAGRATLFREYESLHKLATNFAGRSYNLDSPADRQAMKINLLRSIRPQALKVLEELAAAYHGKFDRRLPISSLVRPEQYQHALHRVNRNAVLIDTPPHSTGLAFDIDYRYMSAAEQAFVMGELARLKDLGRIEVLRERKANYHVFAFIDGSRPGDDLITAALEKAGGPIKEANHAEKEPAKKAGKSKKSKKPTNKPKSRRRR